MKDDSKPDFRYCRSLLQKISRKKILYTKRSGKWESLTANKLKLPVDKLSIALLTFGIKKKENVASIFSDNTFDWNIIDSAIAQIGAVHVPVYPTISDSDYLSQL